jgi:hypothetical protein
MKGRPSRGALFLATAVGRFRVSGPQVALQPLASEWLQGLKHLIYGRYRAR